MRCRVKFLITTYLWTLLVFVVAKIAFLLFCDDGHTLGESYQVIAHGLSLDLSTALYVLIIPFLLSIVSIWYWSQWLSRLLRGYFLFISLALALAFVADTSLYPFWGFKLDASCLQYLESPNEMAASVSIGYLVWRFVALIVLTIVIFLGYRRFQWSKVESRKSKVRLSVFHILLMPLIVIGIRGGLDESTTNIGQVYFSQDQFLNHAAVNPVFSFLYSVSHQAGNTEQY